MESIPEDRIKSVVSRILNEDPSKIFLLPAENAKELEAGDNFLLTVSELVRHTILLMPGADDGTPEYRLDFEGEGCIQSLLDGEHPHTPILALSDILPKLNSPTSITRNKILETYQELAFTISPQCRPCDTDFIGTLNIKLAFVNGLRPATGLEVYINEFGAYDASANTTGLNRHQIKSMVSPKIDQSTESDSNHDDYRLVKILIAVGDGITADQLIQSYAKGSCYQHTIRDLVLMIEEEDECSNREEWQRICVDLLAQTDEAEAALSAIEQIAQKS
jgi:hypothetical protein